jgi:outer membrane protein assembly factor BamA
MPSVRNVVVLLWLTPLAFAHGCASIPAGRSAVDSVTVRGAHQIDGSDVEEKLVTSASPKFLGLFRGVIFDYEIFNRAALQRDLARVERFYRARGYYDAHAVAGLVTRLSPRHVRVDIEVDEGLAVLNKAITFEGIDGLPGKIVENVQKSAAERLPEGKPFDEDLFKQATIDVRRALTDNGYAYAKVKPDALVDVVRREATVVFTVDAGAPSTFGTITIEERTNGSDAPRPLELPEAPIRRAIDIHEGEPYSTKAIDDATRTLLDLGLFSALEITPELSEPAPDPPVVPLKVSLEPNSLRHVRLGGGVEFDQIKTDVHLLAGWEDHNFLGGLRTFSVDFKPGLVMYPTRLDNLVGPSRLLPAERLGLQLRQPGFIEARTNWFIRPEFNIYPLLFSRPAGAPKEDLVVVGYREIKAATWVDRSYGRLYASLGHNVQVETPFAYKGALDDALKTIVISYPELTTNLDFRDDRVHTHKGIYLGNNLQVAGGPFGGDARDVKVQPEVRTYLPIASEVTFATRASIGLLYPFNYGDVVRDRLGDPTTDANKSERVRDIQTVLFRGFFSGGPSSNRGFPVRGIAPHGIVPFLNPATAGQQVALGCTPARDPTTGNIIEPNPLQCSVPIGGFTLWELSNEIRFSFFDPLSAAVFCDMSDVSAQISDIRLSHLHLSCGAGARYETPVGPIRLDVGYRIQPLQVLGFRNEDDVARRFPSEGLPPKLFGVPIAIAFGIGEAY